MRISKIKCNNFKSLVDFEVALAPFTCLVGMNGSGKSTLLQLVDFLSQLMRGRMDDWLEDRNWSARELTFGLRTEGTIEFAVELIDDATGSYSWSGRFDTNALRCTRESFESELEYMRVGDLGWSHRKNADAGSELSSSEMLKSLNFQGSILSVIGMPTVPASLIPIGEFVKKTHSMELLSPESMRSRSRQSTGSVGARGEGLAAYVSQMTEEQRQRVTDRLRQIYPRLETVQSKAVRAGWKQLSVSERVGNDSLQTEARHINDGLLRLLAVVAELESDHSCLLFDEIENGVNPETVQFLIDTLTTAKQQIIVTTHSPVILNYLTDDVAKESMVYLYKNPDGITKAVPFFEIPSMAAKLKFMGPGEVFADTDLTKLANEIAAMGREGADVPAVQR